ncbi:hypothetical protein VTL71DRAFT_6003 [Oculimacula yallundae]|uniref:HpcH/HpaI aldolase/citrate lyase domain-containing protein n=1 Tax=Oculimacula yallundae TaxID=86028 RepID=A0ABR4C099_9HELO
MCPSQSRALTRSRVDQCALDSGVLAIILPMVNDKEDVDLTVKQACCPPLPQRSSGPFRTPSADLEENTMSFVILENAEDIMTIEGASGIPVGPVVGPDDLRSSMGLTRIDRNGPVYLDGLKKILDLAKRIDISVGALVSQDNMARPVEMGFSCFLLADDAALLVGTSLGLSTLTFLYTRMYFQDA